MVEELSSDELKEVLTNLQTAAKCSVCLACVRPPVTLCVNGHMICSVCKPAAECNGNVCPYCKSDFSNIICIHIDTVLNALPKDHNYDCKSVFCEGTNHCSTCELRPAVCHIVGCEWNGHVQSLLNHLQQKHKIIPILESKNCTLGCFTQLKQISTIHGSSFTTPILAHGCLFWKHIKIDTDKQMFLIFLASMPTNADHLRISVIKFGKDDKEFSYSQKIFNENVKIEKIFERVECISIPFNQLSYLVNFDGRVNYSCEIIKLDKATYDILQF